MKFDPFRIFRCGSNFDFNNAPHKVSAGRRIAPQFLSSIAQNLVSWNMGLVLAIPTIVTPSVTGRSSKLNPDEILHMTEDEASWLASLMFIVQPIGNLLSGFLTETFGRQKTIVIINVVPAIAWIMLPNVTSQHMTYIAFCLLGIGNGLTSSITYITEISEPSLRGVLSACSGISTTVGMLMIFLFGSFMSWRQVAYIAAIIPIIDFFVALFVPETPIWLYSNGRPEDAQKSLQVLRGWVSTESVSREYEELKTIREMSVTCGECEKLGIKCDHPPPTLLDKLKDMTNKRSLKPFILVTTLFLFMQFSGMFIMRPYIVQILIAHGISLDPNFTTVILGVLGILANVFIVFTVRTLGKRRIYLYSMIGNSICSFGLSAYGWVFFPSGWISGDIGKDDSTHSAEWIRDTVGGYNYFAMAMFFIMHFCVSVGISSIPYIMMFELFPYKLRSFYCGITGAENQLFAFIATKTFFDFERWLSLPGVICFYGVIGVFGYVLMLFMLPETEHRSLQDIELHFSDSGRSIFDINIEINAQKQVEPSDTKQKF